MFNGRHSQVFRHIVLVWIFAQAASVSGAHLPWVRYIAASGASVSQGIAFRTQFELLNEAEEGIEGQIFFFARDGGLQELEFSGLWIGEEGHLFRSENGLSFEIPPRSTLVLTLIPAENGGLGWVRLEAEAPLLLHVFNQVARISPEATSNSVPFEHFLEHQSRIDAGPGSKRFVFPVQLFHGFKRINTAFSVVNLSGVSATVQFLLRPGNFKEVRLEPGQMIADYFDRFWNLVFPLIFPLQMRGTVEIVSPVPLAVTGFRTLDGFPVSGIEPAILDVTLSEKQAALGEEVVLAVDEEASFESEGLFFAFWNVLEDSRCPGTALCVWEGRVVVELKVETAGESAESLVLSFPGQGSIVAWRDYQVELVKVEPQPLLTAEKDISNYRITLRVSKSR